MKFLEIEPISSNTWQEVISGVLKSVSVISLLDSSSVSHTLCDLWFEWMSARVTANLVENFRKSDII